MAREDRIRWRIERLEKRLARAQRVRADGQPAALNQKITALLERAGNDADEDGDGQLSAGEIADVLWEHFDDLLPLPGVKLLADAWGAEVLIEAVTDYFTDRDGRLTRRVQRLRRRVGPS